MRRPADFLIYSKQTSLLAIQMLLQFLTLIWAICNFLLPGHYTPRALKVHGDQLLNRNNRGVEHLEVHFLELWLCHYQAQCDPGHSDESYYRNVGINVKEDPG